MPTAPNFPSLPQVLETIETLTQTLLAQGNTMPAQEMADMLAERQRYVDWLSQPERTPAIQALPSGVFQDWLSRISSLDRQIEAMFAQKAQQQGAVMRHIAHSREALKRYYVPRINTSALGIEKKA